MDIILFLTFLTLRACNVIDWAWYWVLSPIWIGVLFHVIHHLAKHPES